MRLLGQVCLRINPEVEAGEHAIVKTGTVDCKFGIALNRFAEVRVCRLAAVAERNSSLTWAFMVRSQKLRDSTRSGSWDCINTLVPEFAIR